MIRARTTSRPNSWLLVEVVGVLVLFFVLLACFLCLRLTLLLHVLICMVLKMCNCELMSIGKKEVDSSKICDWVLGIWKHKCKQD